MPQGAGRRSGSQLGPRRTYLEVGGSRSAPTFEPAIDRLAVEIGGRDREQIRPVERLGIQQGVDMARDDARDVSAAKRMTFTGTRGELRERLARREASGATGIIF